jgi:asparagine synthase (glutamine-hydrolysing)
MDETQSIVELISMLGPECLKELDGMFALAWIDTLDRSLYFARDGLGIKPLYFSVLKAGVVISSELKGLSTESGVENISWAEPGTLYQFRLSDKELERYDKKFFLIEDLSQGAEPSPEEVLDTLDDAVHRCVDTPKSVGVLLSGGVDSSAVLGLGLRHRRDLVAVCAGRTNSADVRAAVGIAGALGVELLVGKIPSEDGLFSTVSEVVRVVESYEPNLVRQGSASLFLSKMARDRGLEVLLCGEGADELFCGYPEFSGLSGGEMQRLRISFLRDLHRTQLQRVDRTSMAFTLEVRVPYLLRGITSCALRTTTPDKLSAISSGRVVTKRILRSALAGVIPDEWRLRPKMVLSEGMGLGGNDPDRGMFSRMAREGMSRRDFEKIKIEYQEWEISSHEEALYFREFNRLGYTKLWAARNRVCANKVNSRVRKIK